MEYVSLNGRWESLCYMPDGTSFAMVGQVPGCSIQDLVTSGKLPSDLFWRDNADAVQSFERCNYEYTKYFNFNVLSDREYILKFAKLDTYCKIWLNGILLQECMDEHIPYSIPVTDQLRSGENILKICFDSAVVRAESMPARQGTFTTERLNTRRTQCTYGWDWVTRFVGCGISGDVGIESWECSEPRLDSLYVYTRDIDEEAAGIGIDITFLSPLPNRILDISIYSPDGTLCRKVQRFCAEPFVRIYLDIPNAQLWYPLGYGAQPLYTVHVSSEGKCLRREQFGIRTVKILQLPDEPGSENYQKCKEIQNPIYDHNQEYSGFILKVNGKRILCKGANWVPCEPFYNGNTDAKITRALEIAAQGNLNMIRVWGGGTFETEHFYNECSRLGIMVTQDFLMACGQYPEDEPWFIDCLQQEATYAARLIRNKPCLMWWSGDNENAVLGCDLDENYSGRRSAYMGIGPVLYQMDPYRQFLPSSPYGGNQYASNTVGTTHNTQFFGDTLMPYMLSGNCENYRQVWKRFSARFMAEEPQMGAASEGTLRKFMTEEDIYGPDDTMWRFHTKGSPPQHLLDTTLTFAETILGPFASPKDKYFKLRYIQYEWVRLTMEQARRQMWFQSGMVYWMFNDCWPAGSGWAFLDYYNKPKDGWYAFRRCAKKIVISIDNEEMKYKLYVSNESDAVSNARIILRRVTKKAVETVVAFTMDIPAAESSIVGQWEIPLVEGELLVADIYWEHGFDRTFYQRGALTMYPSQVQLVHLADIPAVEVSADTYVHAVELEGDAVFEDNCFSLLPGETRRIAYKSTERTAITVTAYTNLH